MEAVDIWSKVAQFGVHKRSIDDPFYVKGNELCHSVLGKKSVVILDHEEFLHHSLKKFDCSIPGCLESFENLLDFEAHYNTVHKYVCGTCRKRLPSLHLLDLHVSETHDSYFAALAERKPMYQCFVEDCGTKYLTTKERHSHCIEVHKFPSNFRYDVDKRKKKADTPDATKSSKPLSVPKFTSFGQGVTRGFIRGRGRGRGNRIDITEVSMTDLQEALPIIE